VFVTEKYTGLVQSQRTPLTVQLGVITDCATSTQTTKSIFK